MIGRTLKQDNHETVCPTASAAPPSWVWVKPSVVLVEAPESSDDAIVMAAGIAGFVVIPLTGAPLC